MDRSKYIVNRGVPAELLNQKQPNRHLKFDAEKRQDPLLDIIFAIDEVTKLPKGDIALYLGKDCDPDIRKFIEANLMAKSSSVNLGTNGVDDDTILQLTRNNGESQSDYATRIKQYIVDNGEKVKFELKRQKSE